MQAIVLQGSGGREQFAATRLCGSGTAMLADIMVATGLRKASAAASPAWAWLAAANREANDDK